MSTIATNLERERMLYLLDLLERRDAFNAEKARELKPLLENEYDRVLQRGDFDLARKIAQLLITLNSLLLADNQRHLPYEERDYAIMASNIFHRLCLIDQGREPEWHDIRVLAEELKAFENRSDVAYIAEAVLVEMQYIERDPHTIKVRLTPLGRQNCGQGIDIPPSDIQKLRRIFENVAISERLDTKKISID